jgi:hypothetical protein
VTNTYVAYIDESGDDGLGNYRLPGARGGASQWLIISALVYRQIYDLDAVHWRDSITDQMREKRTRDLHFANLNHGQKLLAVRGLAMRPVRAISVIGYKPNIPDGIYTERNQLYFYLTRYLIERISWLCRDLRPRAPEGDGKVSITFSRRGGMSYDDFCEYMVTLRDAPVEDVRIHWPVIDVNGIRARDHSTLAGLQLSDTIASAFSAGIEQDRYGNCESRYAEILTPIVYQRNRNYFSYGVKFFPAHDGLDLTEDQLRLIRLFE